MLKRTAVLLVFAVVFLFLIMSGCGTKSSPSPTSATLPPGQEPLAVVSVIGPIPPYNPGGPVIEITLKNVSVEPVISLITGLGIDRAGPPNMPPFTFTFKVTPGNPLLPGNTTSTTQTLIGGGFSDNVTYPLTINGTLQNGTSVVYAKQVKITPPAQQ